MCLLQQLPKITIPEDQPLVGWKVFSKTNRMYLPLYKHYTVNLGLQMGDKRRAEYQEEGTFKYGGWHAFFTKEDAINFVMHEAMRICEDPGPNGKQYACVKCRFWGEVYIGEQLMTYATTDKPRVSWTGLRAEWMELLKEE
jgi:hypothetical protein